METEKIDRSKTYLLKEHDTNVTSNQHQTSETAIKIDKVVNSELSSGDTDANTDK